MDHDPLCPTQTMCKCQHSECCTCGDSVWCQCDLIAKVRADEAQKAEERVTERLYESWDADLSHQRYH